MTNWNRNISTAFATLLTAACLSGSAGAQPPAPAAATAVAALVRDESTRLPNELIYVRLDDGNGTVLDRIRRDPERARASRLDANLFDLIGRPKDESAAPGELFLAPLHHADGSVRSALLVEASTGYVAYFPQLGKGSVLGEIRTTAGRPFGSLAANDGRYTLLLRRGRNGKTVEAVLYHPPSGRALRLGGLDQLPIQPETTPFAGLPTLGGPVTAVSIEGDDRRTRGYLLFDDATGAVTYATLDAEGVVVGTRTPTEGLFGLFPETPEQPADPRFLPVPVTDTDAEVRDVLIIDAGTGRLAWLTDPTARYGTPTLRALSIDLDTFLSTPGVPVVRSLVAVPRRSGTGATLGAWLIDGHTRRVLAIDDLDEPNALRVGPVTSIR